MPELPEVETMRRGILAITGCDLVQVHFPACRFRPIRITPGRSALRRRLLDRQVCAVERIGKRLVLQLAGADAIVFQPRMTGLVLLSAPPDLTHLRFGLRLLGDTTQDLWFWDRRGLGSVHLLSGKQLQQQFGPDRLGPDALEVTPFELQARLGRTRRSIKVALLDQKTLAGIGNLYASEILHAAGVHPETRCHLISRDGWRRIGSAMDQVLQDAIQHQGSTLPDGTYRNPWNQPGSYQHHHRVYNRQGQRCVRCQRGRVRRIVQAQRSTFFCPQCQS